MSGDPKPEGYSVIQLDQFGPALRSLLAEASSKVPVGRKAGARLWLCPPNSGLKPNRDNLAVSHLVRYQLPLQADDAAVFRIGMERARLRTGQLWRLDLGNRVHAMKNGSDKPRIVLAFDVVEAKRL